MAGSPMQLLVTPNKMLRAKRVRRTETHLAQRPTNVAPELVRFAKGAEAPQRSFAICGCRVDKHARHRIAINGILRVDPLDDRGARVPALDGQLANQCVGECVQQDIPDARIPSVWVEILGSPPRLMPNLELSVVGMITFHPILNERLRELKEDAFPPCFRSGNPSWGFA